MNIGTQVRLTSSQETLCFQCGQNNTVTDPMHILSIVNQVVRTRLDTIECRLGLTVKDRVQVHNEEVKSTLRKAKREQLIQFTVSAINLNRRATNMIGLNSKIS